MKTYVNFIPIILGACMSGANAFGCWLSCNQTKSPECAPNGDNCNKSREQFPTEFERRLYELSDLMYILSSNDLTLSEEQGNKLQQLSQQIEHLLTPKSELYTHPGIVTIEKIAELERNMYELKESIIKTEKATCNSDYTSKLHHLRNLKSGVAKNQQYLRMLSFKGLLQSDLLIDSITEFAEAFNGIRVSGLSVTSDGSSRASIIGPFELTMQIHDLEKKYKQLQHILDYKPVESEQENDFFDYFLQLLDSLPPAKAIRPCPLCDMAHACIKQIVENTSCFLNCRAESDPNVSVADQE